MIANARVLGSGTGVSTGESNIWVRWQPCFRRMACKKDPPGVAIDFKIINFFFFFSIILLKKTKISILVCRTTNFPNINDFLQPTLSQKTGPFLVRETVGSIGHRRTGR